MAALTRAERAEWCAWTLLAGALAAALAGSTGYLGLSWDALNHHIYLGLLAEQPRWDLDVLAASFQGYQYPYLYWPIYRLSLLDVSGSWAAVLWASFQALCLMPPVWLMAHRLLPAGTPGWPAIGWRAAACALALSSGVLLASIETTANDLLSSVPLLWAIALGLGGTSPLRAAACAALLGASIAFKWSNGLAIIWLPIWAWQSGALHWAWARLWQVLAGAAAGFVLTYAPWGWQLWRAMGNPFYPLFGFLFGTP